MHAYAYCRLETLYERTSCGQYNLLQVIAVDSDRPLCCTWAGLHTKSCNLKKLRSMRYALATS